MRAQDTGTFLDRRPFDMQEAAVLLDVYLSRVKHGVPIAKAAEEASARLRSLARSRGYTVSNSYRSASGLVGRLRSISGLYEKQEAKSAPGTVIFAKVIALYKNDRTQYEELLSMEADALKDTKYNDSMVDTQKKACDEKEQKNRPGKNVAEQDFFQWLSGNATTSAFADIREAYPQINVLLVKSKILPRPLTDITSAQEIESALDHMRGTFANKRLRSTAVQILSAYAAYLRERERAVVELEKPEKKVEIQPDWIKYDFSNAQKFERTTPAYCSIGGTSVEGKNWARILVGITEQELKKQNPAMELLYHESLMAAKKDRPYLMPERIEGLHCAQLSNGKWVCLNYSIPRLVEMIRALCLRCGYTEEQIVLYGTPKDLSAGADAAVRKREASGYGVPIERSEAYLQSVGFHGATVKEIIKAVRPDAAVSSTVAALESSMNVIAMPDDRYVHVDSFVDLDEAEEAMGRILRTHFAQFGGYSNNQLLFDAASQELFMFLNDNDCESIDAVYAIARFLFEKKAVAGMPYKFVMPHIFEKEPNYPMTLRGLMIHLARNNGGILYAQDAKDYLQKTMLTHAGLRTLLQIGSSNTFLMYDPEQYLLSESLGIDEDWCVQMHDRLDDLFRKANVAYVIPRDISTAWLATLPQLPHGLAWTRLLLQEVMDKYPAIGFRSISPDLNQTHDTLAAALVPINSPLQTFPDVVTLFMEEHYDLPMRLPGEKLRLELRDAGMLEKNEMIYSLPKALNDYRFAWSDQNKTVYVRGNK